MLDKLYYDLQNYQPEIQHVETATLTNKSKALFSKLTNVFKTSNPTADVTDRPKSLYVYGGAGCGKVFIINFVYVDYTYIHPTESSNGYLLRMYAYQ
jgi:predicted ATPase